MRGGHTGEIVTLEVKTDTINIRKIGYYLRVLHKVHKAQ
jgi:hypothetical protein